MNPPLIHPGGDVSGWTGFGSFVQDAPAVRQCHGLGDTLSQPARPGSALESAAAGRVQFQPRRDRIPSRHRPADVTYEWLATHESYTRCMVRADRRRASADRSAGSPAVVMRKCGGGFCTDFTVRSWSREAEPAGKPLFRRSCRFCSNYGAMIVGRNVVLVGRGVYLGGAMGPESPMICLAPSLPDSRPHARHRTTPPESRNSPLPMRRPAMETRGICLDLARLGDTAFAIAS